MTKLDFDSFEKITEELYRMRDKCGDLPDINFFDYVLDQIGGLEKEKFKVVFEYLDEVYTCLDVCGCDVSVLSKKEVQ